MLEGTDIPAELHQDYLEMLEELNQTENDFIDKVDSILSLIQSRKHWLAVRKQECGSASAAAIRLSKLIKRDQNTIDWLCQYLQTHLEQTWY